jgi:hypothetical protein
LAYQKLKDSQQWVQTQEKRVQLQKEKIHQLKLNLLWFGGWIGSGTSGSTFYLVGLLIFTSLGFWFGVNYPSVIACPNTKSYCYHLRLDKTKVVIPSDYIKQSSQKKSHRQR